MLRSVSVIELLVSSMPITGRSGSSSSNLILPPHLLMTARASSRPGGGWVAPFGRATSDIGQNFHTSTPHRKTARLTPAISTSREALTKRGEDLLGVIGGCNTVT